MTSCPFKKFTTKDLQKAFLELKEKIEVLEKSIRYKPIKRVLEKILEYTKPFRDFFGGKDTVLNKAQVVEYLEMVVDFVKKYSATVEDEIGRSDIEFYIRTWPLNSDPRFVSRQHLIAEGFIEEEENKEQFNVATNLVEFLDCFRDHLLNCDLEREGLMDLIDSVHEKVDGFNLSLGRRETLT